ncbi:F-box family protein [Striga asiatica]|uniref:F-box family protein n=1 Tax=Striga asiatica TaxID=4170 RepID=A0A5A7PVL2_STRAF|nr:F-box family protein [Striga asiatica]
MVYPVFAWQRTDNLISRLPDDILLAILSFLPLKEVGRTSILSSRWKNMWSYISHLHFDDHSSMWKVIRDPEGSSVEREKYVKWVDSVLQSHRGSTVKELRICFSLVKSAGKSITKWLEFAFERHTEKLELNLSEGNWGQDPDESYVFPQELWGNISTRLFNIKMLNLGSIEVSGETIEFLLRGCPLLEQLIVSASDQLTRLEVCGPFLVLKHLEIRQCKNLKSLRISAPNLTSLVLDKIEGLLLEDVPMLTSVYVTYADSLRRCMYVERLISTLRCRLSQLEILTLNIYCNKELLPMLKFPMMPKLKKLVIMEGLGRMDTSLLGLAHIISASPNLQEFEIQQRWLKADERSNNEIQKGLKHFPLHQHLNVFRFLGYYGCPSDVELVNYLLENCVALKEIIVDTQTQLRVAYQPVDPEQLELAEIAKGYAKQQLEPLVPNHVSSMEKIIRASEFHIVSVEREKYVKWVDSVLQSHRGSTVKELRICFSLVKSAGKSITKWLEFAFERHTEKLELNLSEGNWGQDPDESYVFPQELWGDISTRLFNIKMLHLGSIEVSDETIEFLLRGCPLLEQLIVSASDKLTRLEVCGPFLVLKHLEIRQCKNLKSLRISAPKLTSLVLDKIEGLLLEDVPMLTSVYVTYADSLCRSMYVERLISTLRCRLSHLEILTLNIYRNKELLWMFKFPMMPKLKKLVIMEGIDRMDTSLLGLAHFISASPNLQEFELKQSWFNAEMSDREIHKGFKYFPMHQHLNVFRFLGYYACPSDVELVNYLLENCVALKEIIVDTQTQLRFAYETLDSEQLELAEIAKVYAKKQLEPLESQTIGLANTDRGLAAHRMAAAAGAAEEEGGTVEAGGTA